MRHDVHTYACRPGHFLPATLWLILVSVLSLLPGTTIAAMAGDNYILASLAGIMGIDKAFHATMYAVFAGLLLWPVAAPGARRIWLTVLAVSAYGSLMEVLQSFALRSPSLWDALANTTGAAVVAAAWWWLGRQRRRRAAVTS